MADATRTYVPYRVADKKRGPRRALSGVPREDVEPLVNGLCSTELAENFGTASPPLPDLLRPRGFRGSTPMRAARCRCAESPPPATGQFTVSPAFSVSSTVSRNASTAAPASRLERPLLPATASTSSCSVTSLLLLVGRYRDHGDPNTPWRMAQPCRSSPMGFSVRSGFDATSLALRLRRSRSRRPPRGGPPPGRGPGPPPPPPGASPPPSSRSPPYTAWRTTRPASRSTDTDSARAPPDDDVLQKAHEVLLVERAFDPIRCAVFLGFTAHDDERYSGRHRRRSGTAIAPRACRASRMVSGSTSSATSARRAPSANTFRPGLEPVLVEVPGRALYRAETSRPRGALLHEQAAEIVCHGGALGRDLQEPVELGRSRSSVTAEPSTYPIVAVCASAELPRLRNQ